MNPLGQTTVYVDQYEPTLLFAIERNAARLMLPFSSMPFSGADYWNLYELSWLNQQGLPQVAMAQLVIPCDSPAIVESKSLKLYLNSFNQTKIDKSTLEHTVANDIGQVVGAPVSVRLLTQSDLPITTEYPGQCLDELKVSIDCYEPSPSLLVLGHQQMNDHLVYSHLLKSNCPVTNQPDWATIFIEYSGTEIVPESLLAYIVSYRQHQGFHENCVERIFCDLIKYCQPESLSVYARYTRRGGLDINPYRTNRVDSTGRLGPELRCARQ